MRGSYQTVTPRNNQQITYYPSRMPDVDPLASLDQLYLHGRVISM
jgi:hypothetical protein